MSYYASNKTNRTSGMERRPQIRQSFRIKPSPCLYKQIKQFLLQEARNKKVKEDAPFPRIRELCKRFNVSKVTIQKAVDELKRESIIYSYPRKGIFWSGKKQMLLYKTVGVAFPVTAHLDCKNAPYYYSMLEGMNSVFIRQKYQVKILRLEELFNLDELTNIHCDGLIFTCTYKENLEIAKNCKQLNMPYLMLDRPSNDEALNYLERDSSNNIYDLTKYLLSSGHTRIGCIGLEPKLWIYKKLYKGYKEAMEEKNLDESVFYIKQNKKSAFLSFCRKQTAILIADPNIVLIKYVVEFLKSHEIRIPEDCSIITLSMTENLKIGNMFITHFPITPYQMGEKAAKGFIKLLENKANTPLHITFKTKIVKGESVCKSKLTGIRGQLSGVREQEEGRAAFTDSRTLTTEN